MPSSPRYPLSDHYDGRVFRNPDHVHVRGFRDILRWKFSRHPTRWPKHVPVTLTARPRRAPCSPR